MRAVWAPLCGHATKPAEALRRAVLDMLDFAERNRTPLQDISIKELIHTSVTSEK